jgi:hypothetical protein
MSNRFDSLYLIGRLLRVIGVAELVLAVASLILIPLVFAGSDSLMEQLIPAVAVPGIGMVSGVLLGVIVFVIGLAAGLLTFSAGELFNLLLAIEENTRSLLQLQKNKQ